MPGLARRRLQGEWMDDPALAPALHVSALRGLRRINIVSRTAAALWPTIASILRAHRGENVSLLDVACGGGDVTIALAQHARRQGVALEVHGCDISELAVQCAAESAALARQPVTFLRSDVLREPLAQNYTIIASTLFLHHLTDAQIVALLRKLARHSNHLVISDLIRGRSGYLLAWLGTRIFFRSAVVHEDGLRSLCAALTISEARALADQAGLSNVRFERHWPQRFVLVWSRTADSIHAA